jgi:hypothetical protein
MAADVDLANQALLLLGADPIVSLAAPHSTQAQQVCAANFWEVADQCIVEHPWNFATRRSPELAATTTPNGGWDYAYVLPTDPFCLRVLGISGTPEDVDKTARWAVEGRTLVTDDINVKIKYLARVTDLAAWSPGFKRYFVRKLAEAIAYPITQTPSVAQDMGQLAEQAWLRAKAVDGLEGPAQQRVSTALTEVR